MVVLTLIACGIVEGPPPATVPPAAPVVPAPPTLPDPPPDVPATSPPVDDPVDDPIDDPIDDRVDAVPGAGALVGAACLTAEDCASGICEGEGCDEANPGLCVDPGRRCTADLRPFCGCDEVTFRGSGTCPGIRYEHEGACAPNPEEAPGDPE